MMGLLGIVAIVGLALLLVLVLAVLLYRTAGTTDGTIPAPVEAARRSPVARTLAAAPRQSVRQLGLAIGVDDTVVIQQLSALAGLGLADEDGTGRWSLTHAGVAAVTEPVA